MAEPQQDTSTTSPTATDIAAALAAQFVSIEHLERLWKGNENGLTKVIKTVIGILLGAAGSAGAFLAEQIVDGEEIADPAFKRLMEVAFKDITGVDLGAAGSVIGGRDGRAGAAQSLGAALINAIAGQGGSAGEGGTLLPSSAGAENYVTWVTQMALEGWITGTMGEFVTMGQVEALGDLDDALANVLGLGRMTRRVMGPLLDAKVITPFRWKLNGTYRPTLLGAAEVTRQVLRGKWTRERGIEELARQGYSDERISALFNSGARFFGAGDVRTFQTREWWTREEALQHLRDQGYDDKGAQDALRLEGLKRFEQLETQEATAIVNAYANGDIERGTFSSLLNTAVAIESERALYTELAEVRRACNVRHISLAQVEAMVKSGVLNVRDYRDAARREGYPEDEVTMLELQLRWELDKARAIEDHRRELEAQRAAEREARAAAVAARKLAIEAERALHRRGSESDLERAVVRGKIPIGRLEEVLVAEYDRDTVDALLALVEDDRLAYVAQQAAREAAIQRGNRRNVDVGAIEAAVAAHLLTLAEYRARLKDLGFDADDAQLLSDTLEAKLADRAAAELARDAAAAAAKVRSIDLGRYEQLVRRGARTFAQYDALLASLGFEDAARADMVDLLNLQVQQDTAARQARAAAEAALRVKGLSLEQFRRGVLLEVKTIDDYNRFLVEQGFTADAQLVLMAELRAAVADADAARQRRSQGDPGPQAPGISLTAVRRAAQLGVISPDTYLARLAAAGWTDDDIAIDLELLLFEIADVQAARAKRGAAAGAEPGRALSLAQTEHAVKAGVSTLRDYQAKAITLGYAPGDVGVLVAVLERELASLTAARKRQAEIGFELGQQGVNLKEFEAAVLSGDVSVGEYVQQLVAWGYGTDEAELLASLLVFALETKAGSGA